MSNLYLHLEDQSLILFRKLVIVYCDSYNDLQKERVWNVCRKYY